MADDIKNKLPIGGDAKKLDFYVGMFMEHMEIRAKNGKIVPKRVVVVRQLLRSSSRSLQRNTRTQPLRNFLLCTRRSLRNGEIKV